jgi:hypothetical protein
VGGVPVLGNPPCFAAISRFFVLLREQPPSLFGLLGCELFLQELGALVLLQKMATLQNLVFVQSLQALE